MCLKLELELDELLELELEFDELLELFEALAFDVVLSVLVLTCGA